MALQQPLTKRLTGVTDEEEAENRENDWASIGDEEAHENLARFKDWMLASKFLVDKDGRCNKDNKDVKKAFHIIDADIDISLHANGEVEDLVCGPALPHCLKSNMITWGSFVMILFMGKWGSQVDHWGMAGFPSGPWLVAILFVWLVSAGLSMWYEYRAAMFVLPSQGIACGSKAAMGNEEFTNWKNITFNTWCFRMLVVSFLYRVDILTTAVFIGRVWRSCAFCSELDERWQIAVRHSPIHLVPFFGTLPFEKIVQFGAVVMVSQFLYSFAYSYPMSPNLSDGLPARQDGKIPPAEFDMADVQENEVLRPRAVFEKELSSPNIPADTYSDWQDMPETPSCRVPSATSVELDDNLLVPPIDGDSGGKTREHHLQTHLQHQYSENGKKDTYEMRLSRHRRARVCIFNTMSREGQGYGRAVQALVESGRMNLLQWQDDTYLKQAEHNWHAHRIVNEMRRTNFRFFLFATQAFFIPNFQITFFGILKSHAHMTREATKGLGLPEDGSPDYSYFFSAVSTIICCLVGVNYLVYEFKSMMFHRHFAELAIKRFAKEAEKANNNKKRWQGEYFTKRYHVSTFINRLIVCGFTLCYIYIGLKVWMVMRHCHSGSWNVKWPLLEGCVPLPTTMVTKCYGPDTGLQMDYNSTIEAEKLWIAGNISHNGLSFI